LICRNIENLVLSGYERGVGFPGTQKPHRVDILMDFPLRRRNSLIKKFKEWEIDSLLISNPLNVMYLTGFTGDSSFLVLTTKHAILVSDHRFTIQIQEECPSIEVYLRGHNKTTIQAVIEVLTKLKVTNIGVENNHLTLATFEKLREPLDSVLWNRTTNAVEEFRAIKDPGEIDAIRNSIRINQQGYQIFRAMLRIEDSEKELVDSLEMYLRRSGAQKTAFPTIVAIGEHSALPHAPPTNKRVDESDFLLLDWGCCSPHYQSDLTRVMPTPITDSKSRKRSRQKVETKLKKIYTVVLEAQARAIKAIRPGISVKEVDLAARGYIQDSGYGKNFNHGLGHGIGLQTHELPDIRSSSDHILQPGMIVTIEPGIYLEGFGGVRIEDDVLVTPDGYEVLSTLPKEWDEVWGEN
jgi:Xaa-Pro aminopeptidase